MRPIEHRTARWLTLGLPVLIGFSTLFSGCDVPTATTGKPAHGTTGTNSATDTDTSGPNSVPRATAGDLRLQTEISQAPRPQLIGTNELTQAASTPPTSASSWFVSAEKMVDGGVYTGTLKERADGKAYPDVRGSYTWPDGRKYEGEYKEGKRDGSGTMAYPNGSKYTGIWRDDRVEGRGVWSSTDGQKYDGDWKNGRRDGHGIMTLADGEKYDGAWKDDHIEAYGTWTAADGQKYDGEWRNGKRHGYGVMTLANNAQYDGEWRDDVIDGRGIWSSKAGQKYEGDWKAAKRAGHGVLTLPNGEKYDGEWKDDQIEGHGVWTAADGQKYDGEWKNGKREGQGVLTVTGGNRYEGDWENDRMEGFGVYAFADGRSYTGEFHDGKMDGAGKMIYADKKVVEGFWHDDKYIGLHRQAPDASVPASPVAADATKTGVVRVAVNDVTGDIFADGAFVGNSPAKLKLGEGPHIIEIKKAGFKTYREDIKVIPGSDLSLRATLDPGADAATPTTGTIHQ